MTKTVLIMILAAACSQDPSPAGPDAGGAVGCSPACDGSSVCVDTGHYEQGSNVWIWVPGEVRCEPACIAPNDNCPAGMTNLFDRSSTCYCVGR